MTILYALFYCYTALGLCQPIDIAGSPFPTLEECEQWRADLGRSLPPQYLRCLKLTAATWTQP